MSTYVINIKFESTIDDTATNLAKYLSEEVAYFQKEEGTDINNAQIAVAKLEDKDAPVQSDN